MRSLTSKLPAFADKADTGSDIYKDMLFKVLDQIQFGQLVLNDGSEQYVFGAVDGSTDLKAKVSVNNKATYKEVLFGGDMGASETYIQGFWDTPDLLSVIRLFSRNFQVLTGLNKQQGFFRKISAYISHLYNKNTLSGAKKNIAAHYDLSNDFFNLFLDPTMAYSAGIFLNQTDDLETASNNKFRRLCAELQLNDSDHLVEIGTGWGGLAIFAAENYGCQVTTTTISNEQYEYSLRKVRERGLEDKITVLKKDYRELKGKYDKLVSVEMIEAVGHQYYQAFFQTCSSLLKPGGMMMIQAITISDQRYKASLKSSDFIKRYIFPGGQLPCNSVIAKHIAEDTDMQLTGLKDITLDYAETLAHWRLNFQKNIGGIKELGMDQTFLRMWMYYFCFCEGGFRERLIHTAQFHFTKPVQV